MGGFTALPYTSAEVKRADGVRTRDKLLQAVLKIIESEGIRAVTHRAVAEKADVSLASTTYYFKDINDLLTDSFIYFANEEIGKSLALGDGAEQAIRTVFEVEGSPEQLREILQDLLWNHILEQIKEQPKRRVEYSFKSEALNNRQLQKAMQRIDEEYLNLIKRCLMLMRVRDSELHAEQMLALIRHTEYQMTLSDESVNSIHLKRALDELVANFIKGTNLKQ